MKRKQLLPQMICLLLITLFVLSVSGCRAMQSLFVTPTPTPISPKPGEWTASAESLGEFVFEAAPDSPVVTLVSFHFKQFQCGSAAANDEQYFTFELLDQDEWTTLIDWTKTSAIHPGEVNQLAVRGEGAHFEFFINDEFVGEADDSEFSSGTAGLVIGLPEAGDKAVFEFDNFEIDHN
jgi:hypothetical protein